MNKLYLIIIIIFTIWSGSSGQDNWFPKIAPNPWPIGSFGGGEISQADKWVQVTTMLGEQCRIFYSIAFRGVSYLGQYYSITPVNEYTSTYNSSKMYYGYYTVVGLNRQIGMAYELFNDGSFKIEAWWTSTWDPTAD